MQKNITPPFMGEMPYSKEHTTDEMESPLFISRSEAGVLFNALGFTCTTVKSMQCVIQDPVVSVISDEELEAYSDIRKKLYEFLCHS